MTFEVRATARAPEEGSFAPECAVEAARLAGPITVDDLRASYQATGPADFACYPTGAGHAYLRTSTGDGFQVDLVGGGIANSALARDGNAAFALNVFGEQPQDRLADGSSATPPMPPDARRPCCRRGGRSPWSNSAWPF